MFRDGQYDAMWGLQVILVDVIIFTIEVMHSQSRGLMMFSLVCILQHSMALAARKAACDDLGCIS